MSNQSTVNYQVLVCGGRKFKDKETLFTVLNSIKISKVIHGGAKGADSLAKEWAETHDIPQVGIPADWERYGKSAGPIRNQQMLDIYKPDLVIAFPGGRGTADMIKRAREANVIVLKVEE